MNRISIIVSFALLAAACGGSSSQTPATAAPGDVAAASEPAIDSSKANLSYVYRFVTPDAFIVAGMDVQKLRGTPVYSFVEGLVMRDEDAVAQIDAFAAKTGLDPRTDLRSATIVLPTSITTNESEDFTVVLEAQHDPAKVREFITGEGTPLTEKQTDAGTPYWEIDGEGAIAFQSDFAIIGSLASFQSTLSNARSGAPSGDLAPLLGQVDTSKHMYMVMTMPPALKQELQGMSPQAADIQTVIATADASSGLALTIEANLASADSASALAKMLGDLITQAGSNPSLQQMGLADAVAATVVTADGTKVTVQAALTEENLQMVLGMLGAMAG